MARPLQNKVNRDELYKEVVREIELSPNGEAEISSSNLADKFGVQGPTMDYHLSVLVKDGSLLLLNRRGKYNKKIFTLPSTNVSAEKKDTNQTNIHIPFKSKKSEEKFQEFIQNHLKNKESSTESKMSEIHPADKDKQEVLISESDLVTDINNVFTTKQTSEEKESKKVNDDLQEIKQIIPDNAINTTNFQVKELTLDEKIEQFLNKTNQVHTAEKLLSHQDKEIISVMNETIQQNIVYLKDLSEQLTTVENKQLIQHLIDDRNRMNKEVEKLQRELEETRKQSQQNLEKYEIDPNRVRFMQQMIFDTLDNYVNQPNHALALGRTNFRNKISKEINDLVKYTLHLEK
jgi:DNA-binding transcriptional ArsR family regulator